MSIVEFEHRGDFKKLEKFLKSSAELGYEDILRRYGQLGVRALSAYTPYDTGKTASSWSYRIVRSKNEIRIQWLNSNINDGVNIAIILQYGHATRNGRFVQGVDYINPAIRPIFEDMANAVWREVIDK